MLRRLLGPPLALTLALLLLGGCGDDEGTSTVTVTEGEVAETTVSDETAEASTTSVTTVEEEGTPPADETVTELTGFSSPSGNIGCYIDRRSVRCDIEKRDWEPPAAPADCKLDYGQGIELTAGAAPELVCAGDTTLGAGPELPYGQSIGAGLLRCESEESEITCTDSETGRGFTIAQESYELF